MRFYHMLNEHMINDHMIEARVNVVGAPRDGSQQPCNREQCTNRGAQVKRSLTHEIRSK